MEQSIILDCAPGALRPTDLIASVVKDTAVENHPESKQKKTPFFGECWWNFSDVDPFTWSEVQKVTKPRIEALYLSGQIRFGSW